MKRITSILLLLATVFTILALGGCKKKDGVPDGMQLVMGGEDDAFSFYAPEEWTVANLGDIACVYASKIDTSSMTFAETSKPSGTVKDYFESEKSKFPYQITVTVDGEECLFGNADTNALKYVYTYTYKDVSYTCMQIFVQNAGRFYIFTYTANNTDRDPDHTYYEYYLDKVNESIAAFTFNSKEPMKKDEPSYEKDSDGYILVSDKKIAGFAMYVPDSFKVDYSSAFVSVSRGGVNITMSETTYPASDQADYWNKRFSDIEAIADKLPAEDGAEATTSLKKITEPKKTEVKNADAAAYCEYSYSFEGVEYRVYQVLLRRGTIGGKVYVFTYTTTSDFYDAHLDEMKNILGKIEF